MEDEPLLGASEVSINSTPTDHVDKSKRHPSLTILTVVVLIMSAGFSIILPSMWPYLANMGCSKPFYGVVVSMYSVGQFIGSPIFGKYGDKRPVSEVLIVSSIVSIIGNSMYSLSNNGWVVLVARFLTGVGAGNVSTCRAYASRVTDAHSRTNVMAELSAAQGLGFIFGPGLGSVLSFVPEAQWGKFVQINVRTLPGYVSALLSIIIVIMIVVSFREVPANAQPVKDEKEDEEEVPPTPKEPFVFDKIAVYVCVGVFMCVIAVFSVFETLGTPLTYDDFGWDELDTGIMFASAGIVGVITYLFLGILTKAYSDKYVMAGGLVILILGLMLMINYGPHLPLPQYMIGCICVAIGYPTGQALSYALFSKLLGTSDQGGMMGVLTAGGSFARASGPVLAATAYDWKGGRLVFGCAAAITLLALVMVLSIRDRLVAHPSLLVGIEDPSEEQKDTEEDEKEALREEIRRLKEEVAELRARLR